MKKYFDYICLFLMLVGITIPSWATTIDKTAYTISIDAVDFGEIDANDEKYSAVDVIEEEITVTVTLKNNCYYAYAAYEDFTYFYFDGTGYNYRDFDTDAGIYNFKVITYLEKTDGTYSTDLLIYIGDDNGDYEETISVTATVIGSCTAYTVSLAGSPAGTLAHGSISSDKSSACEDAKVALSSSPEAGYHFGAWTVTKTGDASTTITVDGNNKFTMPAYNVTANASFVANSYSVAFDKNGGSGDVMDNQEFTYGIAQNLSACSYTAPTHKYFYGWADSKAKADAGTPDYSNEQSVSNLTTVNNGTKTLYAVWVDHTYTNYRTRCHVEIPAAEGKFYWGDFATAPTSNDSVYIARNTVVNTIAQAKKITLAAGVTLSISGGECLIVAGKIAKSDGSAPSATDLTLSSSNEDGNAALIYDLSTGAIEATVEMYSKVSTGNWQYVAVPYKDVTAEESNLYSAGNLYGWVVGSGWVEVGSSDELEPFVGYAVTNSKPVTFSLAGPLVNTESINIAVGAYKNRVVGNSWTAPIQISQMTSDDFTGGLNGNQTVYLFNTGSDPNGTGSESTSSDRYAAGTYVTVPINVAGTESLPSVISSMQGFYVKNRNESNEGTLKLNYGKHVRPTGTNTPINGTMHAPKRTTKNADDPTTLNIKVSGTNYDDVLLLLEREDFTNAYDGGWDGDKMGDNKSAPRIYTLREDGTKDAVSAVPDLAGKELVFRAGTTDSQYTMSFSYDEDAEDLYLYDNETNTYTQVLTDNTYTFTTTDKAEHPRFTLLRANAPQIATGVENVQSDGVQCTKAHKELRDGQLLIHRGGHTYNAAGILVK